MLNKIIKKYKSDGLFPLIKSIFYWTSKIYLLDKIPAYICWPFYLTKEIEFEYNKKNYKCFFHPYNKTWTNERMIEIPIMREVLKNSKPEQTLEIGNVMSHYTKINHRILDLYEKGKNVINQDAANISGMNNEFNLIFSISTMEHIGWDCGEIKDQNKIILAIESIKKCLKQDGFFIFSVPIGYNQYLDELLRSDYFEHVDFIERLENRKWIQTDKNQAFMHKFNSPFNAGNALAVIKIQKK